MEAAIKALIEGGPGYALAILLLVGGWRMATTLGHRAVAAMEAFFERLAKSDEATVAVLERVERALLAHDEHEAAHHKALIDLLTHRPPPAPNGATERAA